tara:strand:- start:23 stop:505 length:483 start_codon:yes stop_codon:yes gene_type:complete
MYLDKELRTITKRLMPDNFKDLHEDLHSEIILTIQNVGDDLTTIENIKYYFFAFAYRVIRGQENGRKYGYNIKRPDCVKFDGNVHYTTDQEYEVKKEEQLEDLLKPDLSDTWQTDYKKKLFKIYLQEKSYRNVAKVTKIPLRSIATTLQGYKYELIEKIK